MRSAHELHKAGLAVEQQRGITLNYDGIAVANTSPICWRKMPFWSG